MYVIWVLFFVITSFQVQSKDDQDAETKIDWACMANSGLGIATTGKSISDSYTASKTTTETLAAELEDAGVTLESCDSTKSPLDRLAFEDKNKAPGFKGKSVTEYGCADEDITSIKETSDKCPVTAQTTPLSEKVCTCKVGVSSILCKDEELVIYRPEPSCGTACDLVNKKAKGVVQTNCRKCVAYTKQLASQGLLKSQWLSTLALLMQVSGVKGCFKEIPTIPKEIKLSCAEKCATECKVADSEDCCFCMCMATETMTDGKTERKCKTSGCDKCQGGSDDECENTAQYMRKNLSGQISETEITDIKNNCVCSKVSKKWDSEKGKCVDNLSGGGGKEKKFEKPGYTEGDKGGGATTPYSSTGSSSGGGPASGSGISGSDVGVPSADSSGGTGDSGPEKAQLGGLNRGSAKTGQMAQSSNYGGGDYGSGSGDETAEGETKKPDDIADTKSEDIWIGIHKTYNEGVEANRFLDAEFKEKVPKGSIKKGKKAKAKSKKSKAKTST